MIRQNTSIHKASAVLCRGHVAVVEGKRKAILAVYKMAGGYMQYELQGEDKLRTIHADDNIEVED